MIPFSLAPYQNELIEHPVQTKIFLEGPAGSGKTTVGMRRMVSMLKNGVPAGELLVLVPQRTLAVPYLDALRDPSLPPGGQVSVITMGGLARRMVDLFWPLVAEVSGFARPDLPPSFLTLESALYYMAYIVRPLLEKGFFDSVTIDRNRIFSQIIDNLNKAAIVGFPYTEIGERLRSANLEDTTQSHVFADAQQCASLFREYCMRNNLLDFSLQIEIFSKQLWQNPTCREYLHKTYRHLIADNLEEDTPVTHDILRDWLPDFDSALLLYDQHAGYRRFLGADPESAYTLVELCNEHHIFTDSLVTAPALRSFCGQIGRALEREVEEQSPPLPSEQFDQTVCFPPRPLRFYPQMLDWASQQVNDLLLQGTPPGGIVLLAPVLPDSLRFALTTRLDALGVPYRSHRPSRSLREEPAAQALITLALLAHPAWNLRPSRFQVAYAMVETIQDLDLVRSQLLVEAVYRPQAGTTGLLPFEKVRPEMQQRITYSAGNRYEALRRWLEEYSQQPEEELDFFFSSLFGEVLSQTGFAFHSNFESGSVSANIIESARKFRWAVEGRVPVLEDPEHAENPLGKEYVTMIQDGILAAQYIQSWEIPPDNAVLVAPAYTFLLANRAVDHQIWLDVGSNAWSERLYQPLTHPYILSRHWTRDRVWTDADEFENSRENLYRLILGLLRRCRKQIHFGLCDLNESGTESRGMLLRALHIAMQQSRGYHFKEDLQ